MKKFKITVNGETFEVEVEEVKTGASGHSQHQGLKPVQAPRSLPGKGTGSAAKAISTGNATSPMPGVILSIKVQEGQQVEIGDVLMVLEAMKMENEILAKKAGKIGSIKVTEGQIVSSGELLAVIE